jgi:molybdenum cofactor cytidylyltransferase
VVVIGASADRTAEELADLPVVRVVNADWERGMGRSIRVGVRAALAADPHLSAVIVTLADLPLVTPQLLCELVHEHRRSGWPLVACRYVDTGRAPALFSRTRSPPCKRYRTAKGRNDYSAQTGERSD